MKQIMASESSTTDQGVPSFTYAPADARYPLLFSLSRPLDALGGMLLEKFAGRTLSMKQIYEQHNIGTQFIPRNYKEVLNRLEAEGKIAAKPAAPDRQVRNGQTTFADNVMISFPRLGA
ncbi:hypothetical protein A6A04_19145 [Paramagnetospirillum marisnigri]|uniref:GMT-like wHTH domain-containing protein n=2 Tax=Paramagnetospirillum marisnigri TaxID=1285242 RepID=A0A178MNL7_9PROT|nr:hypothetical protein A6A04_19145 [Paramagnetospirillum marisnigri]